jgi:hypothetical protein
VGSNEGGKMTLVGYWPLNADVLDKSGNGNHGTQTGGEFVTAQKNQGFQKNVLADWVSIPYQNLGSLYSYSLWLKKTTTGTENVFSLAKTLIRISETTLTYWANVSVGSVSWSGLANLTVGWHHIVITQNGTTAILYIDGVSQGSRTTNAVDNSNVSNFILRYSQSGTDMLGIADEVRIYNHALSQTEIDLLYRDFLINHATTRVNRA